MRPLRIAIPAALAATVALVFAASPETVEAPPKPGFHVDPAALERAMLDTTLALLRSDPAAARAAMDRVEAGCRRAGPDDGLSPEILEIDVAFHRTLDLAREWAARGDVEKTWDQLYWIPKGCRQCHAATKKAGS